MTPTSSIAPRLTNALWGLFAGDALAMPAHWYYRRDNIREDFAGGITCYTAPPHPHPEAFMIGMSYQPDVEAARLNGRIYDILGDHSRFYRTSYSGEPSIALTDTESEHGNTVATPKERYHYHHGLPAGANTLGARLVRVLLRSIAARGRYDEDDFLERFIAFMVDRGPRSDPYTEIYLRRWFENYAGGRPPADCAAHQRDTWSIGSLGGMVRPLVVALLGAGAAAESGNAAAFQPLGMALEHQNLTHRAENVSAAVSVTVPLLFDLLQGRDARTVLRKHAARIRPPAVTGKELFRAYRDHDGPGGIPADEMWRLHTDLAPEPLDLARLEEKYGEDEVILERFATACYPEHGLPLALDLAHRHDGDPRKALLANANAGGDNVHRGMLLGLIVGAANVDFPRDMQTDLQDHEKLEEEIGEFVAVASATKRVY